MQEKPFNFLFITSFFDCLEQSLARMDGANIHIYLFGQNRITFIKYRNLKVAMFVNDEGPMQLPKTFGDFVELCEKYNINLQYL